MSAHSSEQESGTINPLDMDISAYCECNIGGHNSLDCTTDAVCPSCMNMSMCMATCVTILLIEYKIQCVTEPTLQPRA